MLCAQCLRRLDTGAQRCPSCAADPLLAGRYRLDRSLGEKPGGESSYRATRVEDGLLVRARAVDVARAGSQLRDAAARITKLEHRSLPRALEYFEIGDRGRLWLVHEYVRGRTLAEFALAEPERARDPTWLLETLSQLAVGLAYLHQQSPPIVHGQISADAIWVADGPEQRICLLDPELSSKDAPAADVRALALVLTSLLTGEAASSEPPARWREHVDSKLAGLLERMLAHNPEHQISSATLREAVAGLVRVRAPDDRRRPPTIARPLRPTPRFMMLEPVPNPDGSVSQVARPVPPAATRAVGRREDIPLLRPDELSRELSQAYRATAEFEQRQNKRLAFARVAVVVLVATIAALTTYLVVHG